MSESTQKALEQAQAEGKYIRKVRSFVKREGRLTKGQAASLEKCWPTMGLEHSNGLLDFTNVFGNDNDVVLEIGFGMGKSLVEMAKNDPAAEIVTLKTEARRS